MAYFWVMLGNALGGGARLAGSKIDMSFLFCLVAVWCGHLAALALNQLKGV